MAREIAPVTALERPAKSPAARLVWSGSTTTSNAKRACELDQLWLAEAAITLETLLNTLLMLVATPGISAPAESATNPAVSAYSMRP